MKLLIPVRSLINNSILMAIAVSSILAIFIFTYIGFTNESLFTVLHACINILVISFFHIFLIVFAARKQDRFFRKKRRFYRYTLTFTVTLLFSFLVSPLRDYFADPDWHIITFNQRIIIICAGSIVLDTVIITVHNLIIMYKLNATAEIENEKLKAAVAESQTLMLRQQIQPHFLFNALNIMKSLYRKDLHAGQTYLLHLADFLRASLSQHSENTSSVKKELGLCSNYIAMQRIRFGNALKYESQTGLADTEDTFIPSLSLQPLLENAIKHNEVTEANPLTIKIFRDGDFIVIRNNLQPKPTAELSTGSGLKNLQKRYELISGDAVGIKKDQYYFTVRLKLLKR